MSSLGIKCLLVACWLFTTVNCQQPLFSPNSISVGTVFNVSCDAGRVVLPSTAVTDIRTLAIKRLTATDTTETTIVQFRALIAPNEAPYYFNNPQNRNWNISYTGANQGVNNKLTMKLVWTLYDAKCDDAGLYRCTVSYIVPGTSGNSGSIEESRDNSQNVTAVAGTSSFTLTVSPPVNIDQLYHAGDNITFTCSVMGPNTLTFRWEESYDDNGYENKVILQGVTDPAGPASGTGACLVYSMVSRLSIQIEENSPEKTYICSVLINNNIVEMDNKTISTGGSSKPPEGSSEAGLGPDVGMIVGIIIGCIALIAVIIIVIFVVRYRKRKEGSYKEDQPDAARDDNLHAPPPVFYPSSKPNKKEDKDTKTQNDTPRYDDYGNSKKEGKSRDRAPYYDTNYNEDQEAPEPQKYRKSRQGEQRRDNRYSSNGQHYASTDVSQSGDESADQSDVPLDSSKSKPRPKRRDHTPQRDGKPLHYAELDLPRSESGSETGRRREVPVEYAEIRV